MSTRLKVGLFVGVLAVAGLSVWYAFGETVHVRRCCGTNCWDIDENGEALDPDEAFCQPVVIDSLE